MICVICKIININYILIKQNEKYNLYKLWVNLDLWVNRMKAIYKNIFDAKIYTL